MSKNSLKVSARRDGGPARESACSAPETPGRPSPAGHLFKISTYIGPDGIGAADLADTLAAHELVRVEIASDGGSLRSGAALADLIDEHGLTVTIRKAISAAAIVATAGPHRTIAADGVIGVHPAWLALAGGAAEFSAAAQELTRTDTLLAAMLTKRSRLTSEQAAQSIRSGRVWTADEAQADGLVDHIGPPAGLDTPPERIVDGPAREAHQLRQIAEHHHQRAELERNTRTKSTTALDQSGTANAVYLEAFSAPSRLASAFDHAAGDAMRRARQPDRHPAPARWCCDRCGRLNYTPPSAGYQPTPCINCNTTGANHD